MVKCLKRILAYPFWLLGSIVQWSLAHYWKVDKVRVGRSNVPLAILVKGGTLSHDSLLSLRNFGQSTGVRVAVVETSAGARVEIKPIADLE